MFQESKRRKRWREGGGGGPPAVPMCHLRSRKEEEGNVEERTWRKWRSCRLTHSHTHTHIHTHTRRKIKERSGRFTGEKIQGRCPLAARFQKTRKGSFVSAFYVTFLFFFIYIYIYQTFDISLGAGNISRIFFCVCVCVCVCPLFFYIFIYIYLFIDRFECYLFQLSDSIENDVGGSPWFHGMVPWPHKDTLR